MNKTRRLGIAVAIEELERAVELLTAIRDEEEDALNNLPESLQESDKGLEMRDNVDCIDDVITSLEDALDNLKLI